MRTTSPPKSCVLNNKTFLHTTSIAVKCIKERIKAKYSRQQSTQQSCFAAAFPGLSTLPFPHQEENNDVDGGGSSIILPRVVD